MCILYSTLSDLDWPDEVDVEIGRFTYFGDNKKPGHDLHDTTRTGNRILREMFTLLQKAQRDQIPPVFLFTKCGTGRDVMFRGLAVPGSGIARAEELTALWRTNGDERFQNYRAIFTILDIPLISRSWVDRLREGLNPLEGCPEPWFEWRERGVYTPLISPKVRHYRKKHEQLPDNQHDRSMLAFIVEYYDETPDGRYGFEKCAAELFRLHDIHVAAINLTRPWRDGGRDAMGTYQVGHPPSAIMVEFALEAKCKNIGSSSGVRDTARLLARIRHRQFGVFVTTSFIAGQAYKEIVEDGQPLVVISGIDIIRILKQHGVSDLKQLRLWLASLSRNK